MSMGREGTVDTRASSKTLLSMRRRGSNIVIRTKQVRLLLISTCGLSTTGHWPFFYGKLDAVCDKTCDILLPFPKHICQTACDVLYDSWNNLLGTQLPRWADASGSGGDV